MLLPSAARLADSCPPLAPQHSLPLFLHGFFSQVAECLAHAHLSALPLSVPVCLQGFFSQVAEGLADLGDDFKAAVGLDDRPQPAVSALGGGWRCGVLVGDGGLAGRPAACGTSGWQ